MWYYYVGIGLAGVLSGFGFAHRWYKRDLEQVTLVGLPGLPTKSLVELSDRFRESFPNKKVIFLGSELQVKKL